MAEGLINHDFKGKIIAKSAGVMPCYVNPNSIKALDELGIDITNHKSQHVDEFVDEHFDIVITVCDHAKDVCPLFHNTAETIHIPFYDPINATGTPEEILNEYRIVRDDIRKKLGVYLKEKLLLE